MTPELLAAGTFVLGLTLIVGMYWLFVAGPEASTRGSLQKRIKPTQSVARVQRVERPRVMNEAERFSTIGPLNALLNKGGNLTAWLVRELQRAGIKVSLGRVVLGTLCAALAAYVFVNGWTGLPLLGLAAAIAVAGTPYVVLRWFATRRLRKFEEQFPEAVDLIARSLRAGHALPTGLRLAAEELPDPVAAEFKRLYDQQNYGLALPDALKEFASRVSIIDARFFVTAVLTQREAGGNLAEVLDNLSAVIRERFRIQRQLRVKTAHGRLTGLVLASLPPAMCVLIAVRAPEQLKLLISDPLGIRMVAVALGLQLVGVFLIRTITKIEY